MRIFSSSIIVLLITLQTIHGKSYNDLDKATILTKLNERSHTQFDKRYEVFQEIKLSTSSMRKIQYIEPFNMCIVTTNNSLFVWDLTRNEVITTFEFRSTQNMGDYGITYNLLMQNGANKVEEPWSFLVVAHSRMTKQLQIFQYEVKVKKDNLNGTLDIVPKGEIKEIQIITDQNRVNDLQTSHTHISTIEETSATRITSSSQIKSSMLLQLADCSFSLLKVNGDSVSINKLSLEKDNNDQVELTQTNIYSISERMYLLERGGNYYQARLSRSSLIIEKSITILKDSSIIQYGILNKTSKTSYLLYQQSGILNIAFILIKNNIEIFQTLQYNGYLPFYQVLSNTNSIYIQQLKTNQIYELKFNCLFQICGESKRTQLQIPADNSLYLIFKTSIENVLFIALQEDNLIAYYQGCQNENEVFNAIDLSCQPSVLFGGQESKHNDTPTQRWLSSSNYDSSNNTDLSTDGSSSTEDSSQTDALQIVQIVIGVVGGIVVLLVAVLCIRKYRYKQFKKQKQKEQEEANRAANANQQYVQQKYLQLPPGPQNITDISNGGYGQRQVDSRQMQPVGVANGGMSNMNGQLSQNQPSPQMMNQYLNNPSNFQSFQLQQQMSGAQNNGLATNQVIVQTELVPPPPSAHAFQMPMIPGVGGGINLSGDPDIAQQQKQVFLQQLQLQQMELQVKKNILQQQLPQIPPEHQYQMNNMVIGDFNNQPYNNNQYYNGINISDDKSKRPQSDYQKLAAQMEEKQYVKQIPSININPNNHLKKNAEVNQSQTPTPIDNQQFKQMNHEPLPPQAAPPVQNQEEQNHIQEKKAPYNYSIPKNGYFFGQRGQQNNQIQESIKNGGMSQQVNSVNNLANTEVLKNNFEQQMMAMMASGGALPADVDKMQPFIQPPPVQEDGEHLADSSKPNQFPLQKNFSMKIAQSIPQFDMQSTQVQKQNFEDEMLKQLQGTEVFQKNKQQQNQQPLQPIKEKEVHKFILDGEEEPANLHKFDDEEDDFAYPNSDDKIHSRNIVPHQQFNPQIPHPSQILDYKVNGLQQEKNEQQPQEQENLEKSNHENFHDFLKDQLGESIGHEKPAPKFIESQIDHNQISIDPKSVQLQGQSLELDKLELDKKLKENLKQPNKGYRNIMQKQQQSTDEGEIQQKLDPNKMKIEDDNKITCKICLDNPPQVVFQCGHTMCEHCCQKIQKHNNICPHCNSNIQNVIRLFI